MDEEPSRSRVGRELAEQALIRVVHHYGSRPEFVLLGGLVPELLCAKSSMQHAGTTDVDVQVNLEIARGAVNGKQLERALRNAEFEPDEDRVWRWRGTAAGRQTVVKFELLADLDDQPSEAIIEFNECEALGAVNLRGTRFAARDVETKRLRARVGGVQQTADIMVTGLAGFLLAKCAAAHGRRKPKDWYDIAFVLAHNDAGGPDQAAAVVAARFGSDLEAVRTQLDDLRANFEGPGNQGAQAYAEQMAQDHPETARQTHAADAVLAVDAFYRGLYEERSGM